MTSQDDAWAQLICSTNHEPDPVFISKEIFVIGRAKDCDLRITDNKLVSGKHCYIQRLSGGQVILHDTSTNGTLINSKTKICKTGELLQHGDEFHVVYKKDATNNNLGYLFQDLEELKKEAEADETQEYDISELEQTISDEIESAEDLSPERPKKRTAPITPEDAPGRKRVRSDEDIHTSQVPGPSDTKPDKQVETSGNEPSAQPQEKTTTDGTKGEAEQKEGKQGEQDVNDGKEEAGCKTDASECDKKTCDAAEEDDEMAESLMCIICQELLHDCISLQPCMHSFCAGCYSDWMKMSNECPSCRVKVDRINKNHIVNNLVDAYLKLHPDKKRPEEDIKDLDSKNKITRDMLYPTGRRRYSESMGSGSDPSDEDDDDDLPIVRMNPPRVIINNAPGLFGFGIPAMPLNVCRQCPNYRAPPPAPNVANTAVPNPAGTPTTTAAAAAATGTTNPAATPGASTSTGATGTPGDDAVPSTSGATGGGGGANGATGGLKDEKVMPTVPPYVCRQNQTHAICLCCMQPMPDRRMERVGNPNIPPQQCAICYRFYCHAYWGCTKGDCLGCLNRFRDMNFGKKALAGLINDNIHESDVLKGHLESKGMSVKDLLQECVARMESKRYTSVDAGRNHLNGDTGTCYACGLRNFKELAYQFRKDIPADQLPGEVTNRPDCYWGKNCRTQKNKPHHAQRFNHICDQIRTS